MQAFLFCGSVITCRTQPFCEKMITYFLERYSYFSLFCIQMNAFVTILLIAWAGSAKAQSHHLQDIDYSKLNIQFEDASAQLKPEYIPFIYKLADSIRRTPGLHVTIRGHVCCVNRNGLAKKRARVVRDYLLLFGASKQQLTTIGVKNTMPVVFPEKNKKDELANMRVDFILDLKKSPGQ